MPNAFIVAVVFLPGWINNPCCAQPSATAGLLHEASHQAGLGRWVDAIEIYQRVLETGGDDLVPADRPVEPLASLVGGSVWTIPWPSFHSRPARWTCHERISMFPAEGLKAYRDRVDAAAAKRLEEARKRSDDVLLEQLLADWFCSRSGEEAIRLLGERAFERADLAGAERWWSLLLPHNPGNHAALSFPNPVTPPATIQARLLLVKLFRGERETVRNELRGFRNAHPEASGLLAGKEGKYADTLDALLADPKQVTLADNSSDAKTWQTFGGRADRNTLITGSLPRYWPGPPSWRTQLPSEANGRGEAPGAPDHTRALAFHPVIAGGKAFVADAARVFAFDLFNGELTTLLDLRKRLPLTGVNLQWPTRIDTRYTLTFADGFLYARLGSQPLKPINNESDRAALSTIVCIGPIAPRSTEPPAVRWVMQPADAQTIFEGAPLVHAERLYVTAWRFGGGDPTRIVVCYRGLGRREPPEVAWEREIGRVPRPLTNEPPVRHEVLTLAGNNVVFGSNAGSIVAIDGRTGKPAWEYRYTTSERRAPPVGRDLTPCQFDGFRIYAAPNDSDRLFCLNAFTGRLLWDREGVDVVHLLGVTHGRLIATFAGPVKGIRGLSVTTGSGARPDGWTQHLEGGLTTLGRGFVTPNLIFWPTRHGLYFLDPQDGSPIRQPVEGAFGNLAYADGCFVATTATDVIGYVGDANPIEPRKQFPEKKPVKVLIYRNEPAANAADRLPDLPVRMTSEQQAELTRWQPLPSMPSRTPGVSALTWFTAGSTAEFTNGPDVRKEDFLCGHEIEIGSVWDNKLVLAGARGATRFKLGDREPIWSWRLTDDSQLQLTRDSPDMRSGRLTGWHRSGNRFYAILNDSRLLAIDGDSGAIIWQHRAEEAGATIPPVSIPPHYVADKHRLLIQLSSGRIRIVNAADGRMLAEFESPRAPWIEDPIRLAGYEQRVVFPEDAESVACFDLDAGKYIWRTPIERRASLTGSLPILRVVGGILLIEVERNIGVEVDALDPINGRRVWRQPVAVGARRFTIRDADNDGKRIYLPGEGKIITVLSANGEQVWHAPLPEPSQSRWRILCAQRHLIAHTVEPVPTGNADREWERLQGWPSIARLTRLVEKQYDASMKRTLPVVLLDNVNGAVLQRHAFPAHGPACSVRMRADSKLTVSTGMGVWQLR